MSSSRFPPALVLALCGLGAGLLPGAASANDAQLQALQQELAALRARVDKLEKEMASGVAINPARKVQAKPGGWKTPDNWRLLAKGMEKDRVIEILGEPDNDKRVSKFEIWQYGNGEVTFYLGRLKSWERP